MIIVLISCVSLRFTQAILSKLRIEKPLTSNEPRLLMEKPKFMQVLQKLNTRLTLMLYK